MNQINTAFIDIKLSLRKLEFPLCVRETLKKADDILVSSNHGWGQKERHMEFISDILSEFVFNDTGDKRSKRKQLTCKEDLELILTIVDHMIFDSPKNASLRNAMFLLLFPSHKANRLKYLTLLTSLSLSCSIIPALDSVAVLLQQVGFSSKFSCNFACSLVDNYFMLVNANSKCVRELPVVAPLFVANFITALTEAYKHNGFSEEPPLELSEMVVDWLRSSKMFVFSPLLSKYQAALPPGSIPMPPVTPHAGLFRWWAVVYMKDKDNKLFTDMEEILLETVRLSSDLSLNATIFTSNDIISILMIFTGNSSTLSPCLLDTFAHILNTAVQTKTLYINTQDFWKTLSRLPKKQSKLFDSIISKNMSY